MAKRMKFIPSNKIFKSSNHLHEAIYRLNVGFNLTEKIAFQAFREALLIENPEQRNIFLGILLNSCMAKKPTLEEVCGFLKVAFSLDNHNPQKLRTLNFNKRVLGLAGSGKKGIKSFNISSCVAIVAASTGEVCIAKACSKAVSSITGSADFIEAVGANINLDNKKMINIFKKVGLAFFKN